MTAANGNIIVGVDGSEPSKAALKWGLGQAELTGAQLHAIIAWEFPAFYSWDGGGGLPPDDFEQAAGDNLDRTVDEALAETDRPRDRITQDIRYGHSAQVLLDATQGADLLVVGSRGHGSFYGALLGSVSQRCAVHAQCPVVIVRQ